MPRTSYMFMYKGVLMKKTLNDTTERSIRLADAQCMDEDELMFVTGGTYVDPDDYDRYEDDCTTNYCCWYLWNHPDDAEEEDHCIWPYSCAVVYK